VYDIKDPFRPEEVAFYVPPDPAKMMDPRPNRPQVIQSPTAMSIAMDS
jgi:hypothetical protein